MDTVNNTIDDLVRSFEIYKDKFQGLEDLCEALDANSKTLEEGNEAYKLLLKQLRHLAYGYRNHEEFGLNKDQTLNKILDKLEGLSL